MTNIRLWQKETLRQALKKLGFSFDEFDFEPLYGGLRKACFRICPKEKESRDLILAFWPENSLSEQKITQSLLLEEEVGKKTGFKARCCLAPKKKRLLKIKVAGRQFWFALLSSLPGQPVATYQPPHIFSAGLALARLHRAFGKKNGQTLLHLDFARGNILFNKKKKVVGVLDFEEAEWGEAEKDIACSLSFLVVDNPGLDPEEVWEKFLQGYASGKGHFDYGKIKKYFWEFLEKRMKEGDKRAFLLLAKKRLDNYQQEIKAKVLTQKELEKFRQKHRGQKIVFVVGGFELLHWGHLEFFKKAKNRGDLLVVGVASDESRKRLKGESFPIIGAKTRAETLCFFDFISGTVIVEEDNVLSVLKKFKPDVFVVSIKDLKEEVRKPEEIEFVKGYGGKVVGLSHFLPKVPSSEMVKQVAFLKIKQVLFGKVRRRPILRVQGERKINKEVKFKDLERLGEKLRQEKKAVVFTSLTADLFHLGHARFIQRAKSLGDVLVVGVPSNKSVTALKGLGRPIVDETARALLLAELGYVDWVVIFDERTILSCLQKLKPDIFFTVKEEWNKRWTRSPEAQFMKSIGGKVVRSERQAPYLSASKMIDKAAGEWIRKEFSGILKAAQESPVLNADFDPFSPQSQLAAREKGFYEQVLAAVAKQGKCVFCDLKDKYLVEEREGIVLTVALYPYVDGHLLIIPRRHIESMSQLTKKEQEIVFYLAKKGIFVLKKALGIENFWFLLREGKGIEAGKTVDHLHFHLIPYDPRVIRMMDTKLTIAPLRVAEKLRKAK